MSGHNSRHPHLPPSANDSIHHSRVAQIRQNFCSSVNHQYGSRTNAEPSHNSSSIPRTVYNSPHHNQQKQQGSSVRDTHSSQMSGDGTLLGSSRTHTSSSTNSGSGDVTGLDVHSGHSKATVYSKSSSQSGSRSSTGPVRALHQRKEESSQNVGSDSKAVPLQFEDGKEGRMRDVDDDQVLISMTNTNSKSNMMSSDLTRRPLSSGGTGRYESSDRDEGGQSSVGATITVDDDNKKDHHSLRRQGSGPYHSDEDHSGKGIIGQPESAKFPPSDKSEDLHKVLPGEDSIPFADYHRKLSHTSSSASSTLDRPPTELHREDSISDSSSTMTELRKKRDEDVTTLTQRLSEAEEEAEGLRKEKKKLERKLKEAEEVAAQTSIAAQEISRLESELKHERDTISKLRRSGAANTETANSLQLSSGLDSVKPKLEYEVSARSSRGHELRSLKESLVMDGKRDNSNNKAVITKLNEEIIHLQEQIHNLEQTLAEREMEAKRQTQIHTRTISDLQTKLSKARQQREEFSHLVDNTGAAKPLKSEDTSHDIATMTKTLDEKDRYIKELVLKLQKLEKTAVEVVKISLHTKTQSELISNLKKDLRHAQNLIAEKEAAGQEEMNGMRTHYDNALRMKNTELAQRNQKVERLHHEVDNLKCQVSVGVEEDKVGRTELQQLLEKTEKECNHWKQKSLQQGIVIQTKEQDVDRLHREVNSHKSTVSAQGKEVERLQRENRTLQGEIETHKITAVTYKEDFESERKDREAVHTKIADMETRYRHQLESIGEELRRKTEEAKTHREALANTEDLLQLNQQQVARQLQEKEEELKRAHEIQQRLHEDVMSKTQQVKQYKKQIEQLNNEVIAYKVTAEAHMSQVESLSKKTEDYGRQKTFKELYEKKLVELEAQCDKLRAENNELRMKQLSGDGGGASGDVPRSRPPVIKAQTLDSLHNRQDRMQALPNPHSQFRPEMRPSSDEGGLRNRAGGSSANYHFNQTNHETILSPNQQTTVPPPLHSSRVQDHNVFHQGRPTNMTGHSHNSPYSSLPSSGFGAFDPQHRQRQGYVHDDSSNLYSPAGDVVDKDSPPSSITGQGGQQSQLPQYGQQRRVHSQIHSMSGNAQRYLPPVHSRPPVTGSQQPPNSQFYQNLPSKPTHPPNTVPPNSSNGRGQQRFIPGQRNPVRVGTLPSPQPVAMRVPHRQDIPGDNQRSKFSMPVEESYHRLSSQTPQLEGYVKPQQVSLRPTTDQCLSAQKQTGRPNSNPSPTRPVINSPQNRPLHHESVSQSPSTGDISSDINTVIKQTVHKVREAEQMGEGEDGEGIPYDPNLVCPKCRLRFREGEIQKFRRHVSSAHN